MAIILDSSSGTTVAPRRKGVRRGTSPDVDLSEDSGLPPKPAPGAPQGNGHKNGRTAPFVSDEDRGEMSKDHSPTFALTATRVAAAPLSEQRRELATRLVSLVGRVIKSHGRVSMAANLQILKRELSRSHDVLGSSRHGSDYLSIVTLVEANLASMDWRSATTEQLKQVEQVLAAGCAESEVNFDDYSRAARTLRGFGLPTMPSFEVGSQEEDSSGS